MMLNLRGERAQDGIPASRLFSGLKRAGQALLIVLVPLALTSGLRAWFQVWSLEVHASESPARAGSVLTASVLTSGRVTVDLTLELVQDGRTYALTSGRVRTHWDPAMDPRPRRESFAVRVTDEMLRQWRPGQATLRARAVARPQFTRLPPPTIREVRMVLGS